MPLSTQLPTLTGLPHTATAAIHQIATYIDQLEQQLAAFTRTPTLQPLTIEQIRHELGANGRAPLNVFQLLGTEGLGVILIGTHAERVALNAADQPPGTMFYETDRTTYYIAIGTPAAWTFAGQATPMLGTIGAGALNQKPTDLGTLDANFRYFATNFNRSFIWSGAVWGDDFRHGAPQRGMYIAFETNMLPGTGWALADGSVVDISTSAGDVAAYTTINYTNGGIPRFVRSVTGATGGFGGAEAVATGVNDASQEVEAGTGADVAAHTHTHGDVATLPPYVNMRTYVRL